MWTDLTHVLSPQFPHWPGSQIFSINSRTKKNGTTVSDVSFNLHTGTHIDAPLHAIPGGATVADIPIERLCNKAEVIEINKPFIQRQDVQNISYPIVFFKTSPSIQPEFQEDYCYLSPEAADYLVYRKIEVVGIDYLSIENFRDRAPFTTHKILLGNGIPIVESLNLANISPGIYEVIIIPLLIQAEASPVRVLAKPVKILP